MTIPAEFNFAEVIMQQLDVPCWQCNTSGEHGMRACDICFGTGYQPTRAGIELLNFLRRQRKRIERESIWAELK